MTGTRVIVASRRVGSVLLAGLVWLALTATTADGDPYRLRGNVFADTNARAPVGLLTLDADGELKPWLSAEAVVWFGANHDDDLEGDANALIIAVTARDPEGRGVARMGRILVVPGAVRPVHLDGVYARANVPKEFRIELFGGVPVTTTTHDSRAYDWAVGGRISRALGQWGATGLAFIERRDHGRLDDREIGVDAGFSATRWLDVSGRASYDLVYTGVSEARLSASARRPGLRLDVFATTLSAARVLPATSLFSVLGDVPSTTAGVSTTWRAAPRLDITANAMARLYSDDSDDSANAAAGARALLRLDDHGRSALTFELRRDAGPDHAGWTGARAAARIAVSERISAAAELELAIPDDSQRLSIEQPGDSTTPVDPMDEQPSSRPRGSVWPWALMAVSYQPVARWHAALAVEMSASPEYQYRLDSMLRVSHRWEGL